MSSHRQPGRFGKGITLVAMVCIGSVLTGCGFQPVYRTTAGQQSVASQLAGVHIIEATDRLGQTLRNELLFLFGQNDSTERAAATHVLSIQATGSAVDSIVSRTGVTSARLYQLSATYTLTDTATGSVVHRGSTSSQAAFDVLDQQFANIRAERDAEDRVARDAARKINDQIAGYFATAR